MSYLKLHFARIFCPDLFEFAIDLLAEVLSLENRNDYLRKENSRLVKENWELRCRLDSCLDADDYNQTYDCWSDEEEE